MAITPLGADEYGFTYNGESSKTYGVYITDGAFYSAPVRDTTRVEIPGRNGAFLQDHGRFKNIQVVYRCTLYTEAEADFIDGMADVRAWLCSVKGYARLTDDFNPNEYRKAAFVDGIGVSNIRPEVGTFDITFDAMPQRFLTSGETAQTIAASGDTITNPTKFPSRPLLEVNGYGKIGINGEEVEVISSSLGRIQILPHWYDYGSDGTSWSCLPITPDYDQMNTGDAVMVGPGKITLTVEGDSLSVDQFTQTGDFITSAQALTDHKTLRVDISNMITPFTFNLGTAKTASASIDISYYYQGVTPRYDTIAVSVSVNTAGTISISVSAPWGAKDYRLEINGIDGVSSQSALGNPLYFDLDIGEAYKIENGALVSVNNAAYIPPDLPELGPGANTITFDNTVTTLKIVPRWWTV